jgi:peptide-methionine (S)-S-oxide reductase
MIRMFKSFGWSSVALLTVCLVISNMGQDEPATSSSKETSLEKATFGSGCFWCSEAVFQQLKGVGSVRSGYAGGHTQDPTYKSVCGGTTGHAEVIQVEYDPTVVTFETLLEVFWKSHDPTTLNRQGNDTGTQYRSIILYHNDKQKALAESYKRKLDDARVFPDPIVTQIERFTRWYPGEENHQDYFSANPTQGYCQVIIAPKVAKIREIFSSQLKSEE